MSVRKYEDCSDCYLNDGRVPEECESCEDGDRWEPGLDEDDDDYLDLKAKKKARVVRIMPLRPLKEAA